MTQYIKVAIIGTDLKEFVPRPVPLIQHLFYQILAPVQPEANRPFVRFPPRMAFHL
ncbi:MAG TPA: hypothetical protein VN577_01525 [Terriglobales bacterium]|nr:hypothetical protein [Terriglobales bacterium]